MQEEQRDERLRAVACIEVLDAEGRRLFASAFHVGDGRLATARRVFEARTVDRLVTHASGEARELEALGVPRYHLDETVDVALLRVDPAGMGVLDPGPNPPRGISSRLVGEPALVLGYDASRFGEEPEPRAIDARFESIVDRNTRGRPFFILSARTRRGLVGAPVLSGEGVLVGLVSPLPRRAEDETTAGHLAVLPVHALLETLSHHD